MISLAQYARNVYQFASKDTEDHIVATVLRPLGLVSSGDDGRGAKEYFSCFALPPATTNVRLAGSHPVGQVASVPRELSGTVAYSATSMAHIGLPYCICVRPVVAARSEWPLLFSPAQKNSSLPLDDDVRAEAPVVVVVDTGCGEAVLRGADVFVPGIYTCSAHFSEGQRVLLGVYMERPPPSAAGSGAQPAKPCSSDLLPYRFKFATAHTLPPDALIPPTESETGSQPLNSRVRSHNSADAEHYLVVIGEGVARMDRGAVFARAVRGVAVEVTWTPFMQPSMAVLERLSPLGSANQPQGTASVFLQNYSSMVPPQLLVNRLSFVGDGKPLMLLDACAAPGGKTSLLLSLMKHKAEQEAPGSSSSHFRLVCCERSLPRFKSLVALLQTHFPDQGCEANSGNGFLSQTLRPLRVDVNKLTPALAQADASLEPVFDGILLDPPCTGMGLRPRFQPHSISRELIADHADYQRTLFRSCMLYLCAQRDRRPQGRQSPVIVYSTCTITMEENEGNVLHFLKSYPSLRLARARTAAEVTLCNSVAVNTHDNGPRFLLEEEIMAVQREREAQGGNSSSCDAADDSNNHELGPVLVLRFMPKPHGTADCTIDDGVGFFVAVFERSGACLDSEPAVVEQIYRCVYLAAVLLLLCARGLTQHPGMSSGPLPSQCPMDHLKAEDITVAHAEEEIPLEILDYSCTTVFEEVVKEVERFLQDTFQTRSELAPFLFTPMTPTSSSASSASVSSSSLLSFPSDAFSTNGNSTDMMISQPKVISQSAAAEGPPSDDRRSRVVIGQSFSLGRRSGSATICVEIHVFDFQHPVGRLFCLPLFLLVRSETQQSSYLATESNFYLSILSTAAGNVFASQLALNVDAPLQLDHKLLLSLTNEEGGRGCTVPLPSPHRHQPNCVPCFAPIGDPFKETFTGCSPPLVLPFAYKTSAGSAPLSMLDASVFTLVAQPTFATHFQTSAYGQPPPDCQCLSDYLDLFQLQIGQRSRVHTEDSVGMSISVWKRFHLSIPWRFRSDFSLPDTVLPRGVKGPGSSALTTWNEALERENEQLLVLCGPHTHPFGTNAVPIETVLFDFQWNQLRSSEAQGRTAETYLNPFALSSTPTGTEVNRKCSVVAHGLVQSEDGLRHVATSRIRDVVNLLLGRVERCLEKEGTATKAKPPDPDTFSTGRYSLDVHTQTVLTGGLQNAAAQEALIEKLAGDDESAAQTSTSSNDAAELQKRLSHLMNDLAKENRGTRPGASSKHRKAASKPERFKDIRRAYMPGSLLSRFARLCAEEDSYNRLAAEDVYILWQRCMAELRRRVEHGGNEGIASALDCLCLPVADPAVDMSQPILVQKLQMLTYCLRTMLLQNQGRSSSGLRKPTDGWDEDLDSLLNDSDDLDDCTHTAAGEGPTAPTPNSDGLASTVGSLSTSSLSRRQLRLITNGEPLVVPPPLPRPPATSDTILQRAAKMNELGASAVAQATRARLQSDSLYNDMCLFLHVNQAQAGRKVRFPDFIQWYSPRDFRPITGSVPSSNDDDYLSERMQVGEHGAPSHIWASLWQRAVPRSKEQIIADSFHPLQEAALVFHWMEKEMTESVLLLEVANACVANTLHRLLSHRFVTPAPQRQPSVSGQRQRTEGAPVPPAGASNAGYHPSSVIPAVRIYVKQRTSSVTAHLEAANAVFAILPHRAMAISTMEFEGVANMYALALREVDEIETSICSALAMECLMGRGSTAFREGMDLIKGLSSPHPNQADPSRLTLAHYPIPLTTWAALVAERFTESSDRTPRQMRARLTCMAERPLNTALCFQQLLVEKLETGVLRLALTLSQEVV